MYLSKKGVEHNIGKIHQYHMAYIIQDKNRIILLVLNMFLFKQVSSLLAIKLSYLMKQFACKYSPWK